MKKNEEIIKLILSALFFVCSFFLGKFQFLGFLISYLIISFEIYEKAFSNLKKGELFDENFLMLIATIGAFVIGEYAEAVMVIWLFELGEYLSDLAVDRSKESILHLMDQKVETVFLQKGKEFVTVPIAEVKEGDFFGVKPGEKVPLDGVLKEGECFLDTSFITGESVPRRVSKEENVLSGCVNLNSFIVVQSTTTLETSLTSKIVKMLEEAENRKANTENFITKFSKIYTPIIVFLSILLVLIPTILGYPYQVYLYKALVFLVTSCPCALVLSIPLGYFCGIGAASKKGILMKGGLELENLSKIDTICFDKTGTLTQGVFQVSDICTDMDSNLFLELAAYGESLSNHPIATSIVKRNGKKLEEGKVTNYQEVPGKGIVCTYLGETILLGNQKWLEENKIHVPTVDTLGSIVYVAKNKSYLGYLVISDLEKEDCDSFLEKVKSKFKLVMLSGDTKENVESLCKKHSISEYYASLLPLDKVKKVSDLKKKGNVLFVGDGMNDAPVMKEADVSISMGGGSDLAIESSDIVLLNDRLMDIDRAYQISSKTMRIIHFNIGMALFFKFLMLILGFFGITSIIGAVFADVGVTLLSVLNTLRIFYQDMV